MDSFQNRCCFTIIPVSIKFKSHSLCSVIYKKTTIRIYLILLSNIQYYVYLYVIQLYLSFEESSLINFVENYNHCLTLNDKFTIMSNCTYFDSIIFIYLFILFIHCL